MLSFLNGWKTILGLVLMAALCVIHGGNLLKCVTGVLTTPEGQTGLAGGLTAIGLAHKVEKFLGKKPTA
jgi:hypothetical protein